MECYPKKFGTISQLFSEPISDAKSAGWHIFNHSVQRTEVICPKPHRAMRVPCLMDNLNRFSCKTKCWKTQRGDDGLDILDIVLNKDDYESEFETNAGFFCGSPPMRTSNPLVHDAEFVKQSFTLVASSLGNSHGGKLSPQAERGTSGCGSSFNGKPKVRIEGFASGNSESQCVVSARA